MSTHVLAKHGQIKRQKKSLATLVSSSLIGAAPKSISGVLLTDLDRRSALLLAGLFLICHLAVFCYVLWMTVMTETNRRFLSLDADAPGTNCAEVPLVLSSQSRATLNGIWDTDKSFNHNVSIFELKFNGIGVSTEQYKSAIDGFAKKLSQLGNVSLTRSPLWSQMTWSSFTLVDPITQIQFFSNLDASFLFNTFVDMAMFASGQGPCNGGRNGFGGFFDSAGKQLVLRYQFPNSVFMRQTPERCPNQGPFLTRFWFLDFGKEAGVAQNNMNYGDLSFDVRVASLVMGLNSGSVSVDGLVRVDNALASLRGLVGYIDPWYQNPSMPSPVYCVDKSRAFEVYRVRLTAAQLRGPEICFLVSSFKVTTPLFFIPIATQTYRYDTSVTAARRHSQWSSDLLSLMLPCKCPQDKLRRVCNIQPFIVNGFYYDRAFNWTRTVLMGIRLQEVAISGPGTDPLGDFLVPSLLYSVARLRNNRFNPNRPLTSWFDPRTKRGEDFSWARNRSLNQLLTFEFNKICFGQCAAVIFRSMRVLGGTSLNLPVNKYDMSMSELSPNSSVVFFDVGTRRNLTVSMCADTFSRPAAFQRMRETPPVKLIQNYYECRNTAQAAFFASIGNAVATSGLYLSIGWMAVGIAYGVYLRWLVKRMNAGAVLLTEEFKTDLEAAQSQVRQEVLYESVEALFRSASEGLPLPTSLQMRFAALRPIFYSPSGSDGEGTTSDLRNKLLYCGQEVSAALSGEKEALQEPLTARAAGNFRELELSSASLSGDNPMRAPNFARRSFRSPSVYKRSLVGIQNISQEPSRRSSISDIPRLALLTSKSPSASL